MSSAEAVAAAEYVVRSRVDSVAAGVAARNHARLHGWLETDAEVLCLIVTELANNAVRHGNRGLCVVQLAADVASIVVEDAGPGFAAALLAEPEAQTGRALRELSPKTAADAPMKRFSMGEGLAGARRFCEKVVLENVPGGGGKVTATLRARRAAVRP
jgi:anti-sigma regulatory factor (Ser/Thr protein kinase)